MASEMNNVVNVFLPMRAGSERVPKKNTKHFAGVEGGLCEIKLSQLLSSNLINTIFVSTNDPEVMEIATKFNSNRVEVIKRPDELASSSTSTDELIKYVPSIMPESHILWTHVTSPFIGSNIYDDMIETYFNNIGSYDSLMTVTKLQKFIWNESGPINYDPKAEKWPRTQTIEPLWEVNSGAFITTYDNYDKRLDRIGYKPYLFQLSEDVAFDIDWLPDFTFAESIYRASRLGGSI